MMEEIKSKKNLLNRDDIADIMYKIHQESDNYKKILDQLTYLHESEIVVSNHIDMYVNINLGNSNDAYVNPIYFLKQNPKSTVDDIYRDIIIPRFREDLRQNFPNR